MTEHRPPHHRVSQMLVGLQIAASAAIVLATRPLQGHGIPWLVALIGIALHVWANAAIGFGRVRMTPDVSAETPLVSHGPYRWVRHPMYTALLLVCGGLVFCPWAIWKLAVWFGLASVLVIKAQMEERLLRDRFPEYPSYVDRTKRFVPYLW